MLFVDEERFKYKNLGWSLDKSIDNIGSYYIFCIPYERIGVCRGTKT